VKALAQVWALTRFPPLDLHWHLPHSLLPIMLLFLFWLVGGMDLGKHVFVGWLVSLGASGGITWLPQKIIHYKVYRLQEVFVAAPVHPLSYMTGLGVQALLYSLPVWGFVLPIMYVLELLPPSVEEANRLLAFYFGDQAARRNRKLEIAYRVVAYSTVVDKR